MTLASWTDTEAASGTFTASVFNTESSPNGTTWVSNTNPPVAVLTAGTGMSPTVSVYAPFNIRLTAASTVGGSVVLTTSTKTSTSTPPLGDVLEYRISRVATTTTVCSSAAMSAGTFIAGDGTTWIAAGALPVTPVASALAGAGSEFRLCMEARIKAGSANTYQGMNGTLTWGFTATSTN